MNRHASQMLRFSECLMMYEMNMMKASEIKTPAALRACDKLRAYLTQFIGGAAFLALLSRALALADGEVSWLRTPHLKADCSSEGLDGLRRQLDPDELFGGEVVLVDHVLGLLVAFIGQGLTFHLVREIWPRASFDELDSGHTDSNGLTTDIRVRTGPRRIHEAPPGLKPTP